MNSLNTFITKTKQFISTYKWLLIPLVPIIIFVYIIFYLFYAQKNPPTHSVNQQGGSQISQSPSQVETSLSPEISPTSDQPYSIAEEVKDIASGKIKVTNTEEEDNTTSPEISPGNNSYPGDEIADGSTNQETLPDGSIKYEYLSDDPNRPHMQIVKNGVVVFRRNLMPDMTLADYSQILGNPEYTSQGSNYYGATMMIYASPTKGIAVVADPQSEQVYEQYIFHAISVNDFVKKYGKDISAYQP